MLGIKGFRGMVRCRRVDTAAVVVWSVFLGLCDIRDLDLQRVSGEGLEYLVRGPVESFLVIAVSRHGEGGEWNEEREEEDKESVHRPNDTTKSRQ